MNAICILCNDIERFKLVTRNLPDEMPDLFVVNDTRLGDKTKELAKIYPKATFIEGQTIIDEFPNHENISRFALVHKLLIPWYMFKHFDYDKILLLDDDVFITDKVNDLIDSHDNGVLHNGLLAPHGCNSDNMRNRVIKYTAKMFGISQYEKLGQVNAGHILFDRKTINDEYQDIVYKWVTSEFFTEVLNAQKSWRSYFLDETFMTFFCLKNNYSSLSRKEVVLIISKYEKCDYELISRWFKKKALIHNCLQKHKTDMFHDLVEKGIIK